MVRQLGPAHATDGLETGSQANLTNLKARDAEPHQRLLNARTMCRCPGAEESCRTATPP